MLHRVIIGLPRWHAVGPAIFAERLVRGLVARGHEARILLTEAGCNLVSEQTAEREVPADLPCDRLPSAPDDTWGQRWEALERYLEERGPCVYLMLHDWRNNVVAPRLSSRVRLVGLVQADGDLEIDQATRLGDSWDAIVAVSDPIHFKLASLMPHLAPRMVTIRNAVPSLDIAPAKAADGPLLIAYSGELRSHQKRLDDMVEVACRLADRRVDFRLTFFGDGPHRAHLEHRAGSLVARGLVTFAGHQNGEGLLSQLAAQHVFLLTSEFEGLSIAMLEAMSRGCVPVVSRLASQSIVIREGENGLAADIGDIDGFVCHLERLAHDRPLVARLASRAFATIAEDGYRVQDMVANYLALLERLGRSSGRGGFVRHRRALAAPPQVVKGVSILPGTYTKDIDYVRDGMPWPDPPRPVGAGSLAATSAGPLEGHRVIVASETGKISGVDVFATHLVRGLRSRGIDARLHGRLPAASGPLVPPSDLPFDERGTALDTESFGWLNRWRCMVEHLERLAPCIYVPNYDSDFSCVAPQLSERVRVVGIGHSDDPWHYEHLCRIGHACDAIVGVSRAITDHLRGLAPEFAPRLATIPYGIPLPSRPLDPAESAEVHEQLRPLRIIHIGRLVTRQKRALDLVAIARALEARGVDYELTIVGDGELRHRMEEAAYDLVRRRRIWFTGAQPNVEVMELLESNHAFLLPSAFEGLSVGMLEAMSRGVVPVVSDVRSGVPDVIKPGENGLVAPVGDGDRFADHLDWLWRNPRERGRMAAAAAETVASGFTMETMIDRYVDLFRRIVSQPTSRIPGPFVPVSHLRPELSWSLWASRVASDPVASVGRIIRRFTAAKR